MATEIRDVRTVALETLARLKALETVLLARLPEDDRKLARSQVDEMTMRIFQKYLAQIEESDPELAAHLDDRDPWRVPTEDLPPADS